MREKSKKSHKLLNIYKLKKYNKNRRCLWIVAHYNSRLYAKDGYHFYSISEYEENKKYYEEEKARRIANNESIEDLILEKNYTTMAITPLTDNEEINTEFKSEKTMPI